MNHLTNSRCFFIVSCQYGRVADVKYLLTSWTAPSQSPLPLPLAGSTSITGGFKKGDRSDYWVRKRAKTYLCEGYVGQSASGDRRLSRVWTLVQASLMKAVGWYKLARTSVVLIGLKWISLDYQEDIWNIISIYKKILDEWIQQNSA